jgi:antitoxin ParD1/3/4
MTGDHVWPLTEAEKGDRPPHSLKHWWDRIVFYAIDHQQHLRHRRINAMQSAEKLSITVSPEMATFIRQKVESGLYSSNSEIIREALRGMMERDRRLKQIDTAIAKGIADAEEGRVQDIDEVRAELHERFAADPKGFPA